MKKIILIIVSMLICTPAFSWSGMDVNSGDLIEITEDREDIDVGDIISVFNIDNGRYGRYIVISIDYNELTVQHPKSGRIRIFDMDDD